MLVKQSSSFAGTLDFISPDLCPPNSPVDYRICGLMRERVQRPVRDTSRCDQRLEPWALQAYHKRSSTKQLVDGESGYVQA